MYKSEQDWSSCLEACLSMSHLGKYSKSHKNPAYGRHWISWRVRIDSSTDTKNHISIFFIRCHILIFRGHFLVFKEFSLVLHRPFYVARKTFWSYKDTSWLSRDPICYFRDIILSAIPLMILGQLVLILLSSCIIQVPEEYLERPPPPPTSWGLVFQGHCLVFQGHCIVLQGLLLVFQVHLFSF